ncbi:protein NO VEIN domain-containing protein [Mycolicibacterium psychrotolerans]|uniref:protein NO VEIN domain-containing protein n=1 Tax=Mycolicibacterium psychrotolerans TaxID=216929 RepID=UPI003D674428
MADGLPNWYWVTKDGDLPALTLEKGINGPAEVAVAGAGSRRPAILIRSSPWRAGSFWTPWHDEFDLEHSHVRYFGDNKVDSGKLAHETPGNKLLRELAREHASADENIRARSAPVLVLRSVTIDGRIKGQVEFCGLAVIVGHEFVHQTDPMTGEPFDNYAFELALLDLGPEGGRLDLRWIQARRSTQVAGFEALELAPVAWRDWVEAGSVAAPGLDGDIAIVTAELDELVSPRGQGFRVDADVRAVIERQAMTLTRDHFESQGWVVSDDSANQSYDFEISKNGHRRRVEVKGTQSAGRQVLLTANEVDHARERYPAVILAIVSGIQVVASAESGDLKAAGGSLHLVDPLDVDSGSLKPITFMYGPPTS